jgi:hypothetical protein
VKSSAAELASTEQVFPAEPIMVSEARRLAAQTFRSWGMDTEQAELACLLVSEVVTNAVLHASITPSPSRGLDLDFDLGSLAMPAPVSAPTGSAPMTQVAPVVSMTSKAAIAPAPARSPEAVPTAANGDQANGASPAKEFALRLRRGAASVWVEVFDPDLRLPRIRTAGETDEGGRGLYLVEQLATRWGSRPTPEGKAVWFEMPRSGKGV